MSDDYTPVSCATHSDYELAIMHKQKLTLTWQDESGKIRTEEVMPLDIVTKNRAEFLVVKTIKNESVRMRLDHINSNN